MAITSKPQDIEQIISTELTASPNLTAFFDQIVSEMASSNSGSLELMQVAIELQSKASAEIADLSRKVEELNERIAALEP